MNISCIIVNVINCGTIIMEPGVNVVFKQINNKIQFQALIEIAMIQKLLPIW